MDNCLCLVISVRKVCSKHLYILAAILTITRGTADGTCYMYSDHRSKLPEECRQKSLYTLFLMLSIV